MAKGKGGRGRKTKTEDPGDKVETRRVEASQQELPEEERILHHIATFEGYQGKLETLKGHYRNARKACKADHIDPSTIDFAIKMKREDPLTFRRLYEERAVALKAIGATFQLSLYDTAFENPVEQAKAEARQAASAGRAPESRWPEGSDAHDAYMTTWHEQQGKMAEQLASGGVH
jgi:hypothetical protein